jgi:predicted transcriptional regulator of viral defense system
MEHRFPHPSPTPENCFLSLNMVVFLPLLMTKIEILLKSPQKVFTVDDLAVLWQVSDRRKLAEVIKYYIRVKRLYKAFQGVYTLDQNYSELELAVNVFPPAYISYITALGIHGISFQYYEDIHVMATASKTVQLPSGKRIVFHQLKDQILFDETGLQRQENYLIASPERTICDTLYLQPTYVFDNLRSIDINTLQKVVKIYRNLALEKRIKKLTSLIKQEKADDAR